MKNIEKTKTYLTPVWGVPEVMAYTDLNRRQVVALTDDGTARRFGRFRHVDTGHSRKRYVPVEVVQAWAEICGVSEQAGA